jgi:hypothetical protein
MPGTLSSDRPAWPYVWREKPQAKFYLAIGFIGLLVPALAMALSIYGFTSGSTAEGAYTLAFAAICVLIGWVGYQARFNSRSAGGETLLLADEPEQDVLGADVVVLEGSGFLLREDDHLACSLCESLEHGGAQSFLLLDG